MARRWSIGLIVLGGACACLSGCGQSTPSARPPVSQTVPVTQPVVGVAAPRVPAALPVPAPKVLVPRIAPGVVTLLPGDPGVQLIADGEGAHGARRDLTGSVSWKAEPAGIVAIDQGGYARPIGPGQATIAALFEGGRAEIVATVEGESGPPSCDSIALALGGLSAVSAAGADRRRPWSFAEDVVPILTRSGCNTGGCHGKADGQNGFHLSLFGYDAAGDYQALTRDVAQRRISLVDPERSLFLGKVTGRVPHGGGVRIAGNSPEYQTLLDWIKAGAPERRGRDHGALTRLRVDPGEVRLDEPGPEQLRVFARYADGHERDVTRLATYRVNDDSAASIDSKGRAVLLRRAEIDLIVRYKSQVVSTRLGTLINPGLKFDYRTLARRNFIDEELFRRLESLRVPPSPRANDATFLRRVALDLTGEQPEPEEVRTFLADTDPEKRVKLVDRLLARNEFVLFWRIKLGDMLQITSARLGNGAHQYQTWVDQQLKQNAPWDGVVRTLLTAVGDPIDNEKGGPVNYALDNPDPKVQAEQTAQRFLALRMRCAQCHDHPFDVWTQDDYFGLAACFAKVQANRGGGMNGRTQVKLNPNGQVEHLRTRRPAEPRVLDGKPVQVAASADPRKALADWITAPSNPFFARATANWVWAQFFGKGLADPPDDLSRSNPPVHPELLDALARHFIEHKYDLRDLIRTVATSEAYGLSSATVPGNERDTRLFSHQIPRPLTAHQMADALAKATDVPNRYSNSAGQRQIRLAIEVPDPSTASQILDAFGRCTRANGCASVATPALSLRQALLLMGGDVIESKIGGLTGYIKEMFELPVPPEPEEIVENLYLRTLCRPATAEELSHWSAELKQAKSLREAAEDLFWALLNAREFSFNH